jgi:hypothetical protein
MLLTGVQNFIVCLFGALFSANTATDSSATLNFFSVVQSSASGNNF